LNTMLDDVGLSLNLLKILCEPTKTELLRLSKTTSSGLITVRFACLK
jgi:hypothetical protein